MDLGKAFTFPFQTSQLSTTWVEKLLLPALITLIPIFGWIFLMGWYLDITHRVIAGYNDPLPDLDLGRQFVDGLKALVITLVYAVPLLAMGALVAIAAAINSNTNSTASNVGFTLTLLLFLILMSVYIVAMAVVLPAALSNFIAKADVSAAFHFNEVFGLLSKAPSAYLIVFLVSLLTGAIAPMGSAVCGIGVAATLLYAMAVNGYVYGAAYNQARQEI